MVIEQIIFAAFAGLAILSALGLIISNNPVRAALFLVLTFVCSGVVWLFTQAEFLALVLVLVYVGAVMTLFLFVVMMMNIDIAEMKQRLAKYFPIGAVFIAALVGFIIYALYQVRAIAQEKTTVFSADYSNIKALGSVLYTQYAYPFELAAVILLVAMVAAISLAFRTSRQPKIQVPSRQIDVTREDSIRLVNMPVERGE